MPSLLLSSWLRPLVIKDRLTGEEETHILIMYGAPQRSETQKAARQRRLKHPPGYGGVLGCRGRQLPWAVRESGLENIVARRRRSLLGTSFL